MVHANYSTRVASLLFCLHMSVIIAFLSTILDLVQLLIRGSAKVNSDTGLESVSGLISVREVGLALSFGLRFLFFWGFVAQPPPGESRPAGNAIHNGSWRRWGVLGLILEMFTLALVLIDPVLQILYRLITSLHKIGPVYEIESTIQVVLSAVFILKILLNCWVKMLVGGSSALPVRKTLAGYSPVITALVLSALIGIGNIAMCKCRSSTLFTHHPHINATVEFTETVLGRFLQAVELYIIIVFMLTYAFYHLRHRSWSDSPKPRSQAQTPIRRTGSFRGLPEIKSEIGRPVMSSPELLQVFGQPTLLQRASAASRMSSWMNIRRLSEKVVGRSAVPSADLEKARLWYHDPAGRSNYDVAAPVRDSGIELDTPRSATLPKQNSGWQDPVYTTVLPPRPSTPPDTMQSYYGDRAAASSSTINARDSNTLSRVLSPVAPSVTVPPRTHSRTGSAGDDMSYAIYEESPRSALGSPLSGIDEIIDGYDERRGSMLRPPSTGLVWSARSSRISELIRQQEELDKSIVALRLFSPAGDGDSAGSGSRPLSFTLSQLERRAPFLTVTSSNTGDTRATRSTTSELSLSNFPEPPKSDVRASLRPADTPPPVSRGNSQRSRVDDVIGRESAFLDPEPVNQPMSRKDLPRLILEENSLRHTRKSSQALSVDDNAMLTPMSMLTPPGPLSGARNHVNSGGTQYEITSFIGSELFRPCYRRPGRLMHPFSCARIDTGTGVIRVFDHPQRAR